MKLEKKITMLQSWNIREGHLTNKFLAYQLKTEVHSWQYQEEAMKAKIRPVPVEATYLTTD